MSACIKFGEKSQDVERKRNYDGRTNERNDRQPKSYIAPPPFQSGAINNNTIKYLDHNTFGSQVEFMRKVKPPFHWTAIPLRFEILVKMTRIVTEIARKVVVEAYRNFRFYVKGIQKRNESVAPSARS